MGERTFCGFLGERFLVLCHHGLCDVVVFAGSDAFLMDVSGPYCQYGEEIMLWIRKALTRMHYAVP
jgi:hypothetical protein